MMRQIMMRQMRMAAFAVAVTVVLSGLAAAYDRDDDDHYRGHAAQTRDYGYQNGYNDGLRKGRHEGKENDPYDFRSREWQNADHGYKSWMGPFELFREGYRDGYRAGFESGFQSVRGGGTAIVTVTAGVERMSASGAPPATLVLEMAQE